MASPLVVATSLPDNTAYIFNLGLLAFKPAYLFFSELEQGPRARSEFFVQAWNSRNARIRTEREYKTPDRKNPPAEHLIVKSYTPPGKGMTVTTLLIKRTILTLPETAELARLLFSDKSYLSLMLLVACQQALEEENGLGGICDQEIKENRQIKEWMTRWRLHAREPGNLNRPFDTFFKEYPLLRYNPREKG